MPRTRKQPANATPRVESFDFTAARQRFTDPQTFSSYCYSYPDKTGCVSYIYRLSPVIDREQAGIKDTSIEKVTDAVVTLDYLAQKWGSGRYLVMFNDGNRPEGSQQVARCTIEIDDPTLQPKINPAELVVTGPNGDKNASVISDFLRLGWTIVQQPPTELKPQGFSQLVPPAAPGKNSGSGNDVATEALAKLALEGRDIPAGSIVIDRATFATLLAGRGGSDDFDRALKLAERIKPNSDPMAQLLFRLAEKAILQASSPAAASAQDPFATMRNAGEFFKDMGWSPRGDRGGGGGAGWMDLVVSLPELLKQGAMFFAQMAMMRSVAEGAGGAPAAATVSAPGHLAAAAPAANATQDNPMMNPVRVQAMIALGQRAVSSFQAGMSGDDFAEQVEQTDAGACEDLVMLGKGRILDILAAVPGLSAQIAPRQAELEQWIDDFLGYWDADPPPSKVQPIA